MLATLRSCNYDPGQCIETYLTVGEIGERSPISDLTENSEQAVESRFQAFQGLFI